MANVNGTYYNFTIPPAPVGSARDVTAVFRETFTPGGLNDTRRLNKVPINVMFGPGCFIQCAELDSGVDALVLTLRVTDGTTTKKIIDASTVGQAGGIARPTKAPATEDAIGWVTDNNNYWVELLVATAAGTAASGVFQWGLHFIGWAPTGMKH